MTVGSDVTIPFESLILLIISALLDFLVTITDLIPDHSCFILLLFRFHRPSRLIGPARLTRLARLHATRPLEVSSVAL